MFTEHFDDFVCVGESISCEVDGIKYIATVYYDDNSRSPDKESDGYWPSLNPDDAGYIGPRSKSTLRRHRAHAERILDLWNNDAWFYCGVAVQAIYDADDSGIKLTDRYAHAVWGVECNYPELNKSGFTSRRSLRKASSRNAYLREVANELLDECMRAAEVERLKIVAGLARVGASNGLI